MSTDTLVADLVAVLHEITEGRLTELVDPDAPNSIRRLGLDSVTTLAYLVAVEDAFGIEWDDDLPESVLASFHEMAHYIAGDLGT